MPSDVTMAANHPARAKKAAPFGLQFRFAAIWIALGLLLLACAVLLPRSVAPGTLMSIIPFAAFLTIAAMGQAIVIMGRGIDLSVPAIVSLSCSVLLGSRRAAMTDCCWRWRPRLGLQWRSGWSTGC